ncbi:MAG: hypothetical protein OET90_06725, partial [Desulfuromonadales bacterium]|nr:hypothetical protein [Desulfuromonadales bacterium]
MSPLKQRLLILLFVLLCVLYTTVAAVAATPDNAPKIISGHEHTFAIDSDRQLWVWGKAYPYPTQLGMQNIRDIEVDYYVDPLLVQDDGSVLTMNSSGDFYTLTEYQNVRKIDTNNYKYFVLKNDGTVWSKGRESQTEDLGRGEPEDPTTLGQLPNLTQVIDIAVKGAGLALRSDGTVWAWGVSYAGLGVDVYESCGGDRDIDCSLVPRQVTGLSDIVAIANTGPTRLALDSSGQLWVWGSNFYGQFGNGYSYTQRVETPRLVPDFGRVTQLRILQSSCMALTEDGTIWSWGEDIDGSRNHHINSLSPTAITGLGAVEHLFSSDGGIIQERAFAVDSFGNVWSWGVNGDNLLGDGSELDRATPVPVIGENGEGFLNLYDRSYQPTLSGLMISGPSSLQAGITTHYSATAIYTDMRTTSVAASWSLEPDRSGCSISPQGRLTTPFSETDMNITLYAAFNAGQRSLTASLPVRVQANSANDVAPQILAAGFHSTVLLPDGTLRSWGDNAEGQLGLDSKKSYTTPQQVNELTDVVSVAGSHSNSYALKNDGTVWGWGRNTGNNLNAGAGSASGSTVLTPVRLTELEDIVYIASDGNEGGMALGADQTVWVWDRNTSLRQAQNAPEGIVSSKERLVLTADGSVWEGLLRTGVFRDVGLSNIVEIATGFEFMSGRYHYALDSEGAVWRWKGQTISDSGEANYYTPARITSLEGIVAIDAYGSKAYALSSEGSVWSWSEPGMWVVEDSPPTPAQIPEHSEIVKISAGTNFLLTMKQNGTVWAYGRNREGQLGIGTISDNEPATPVVSGRLEGFLDLAPDISNDFAAKDIPPFLLAKSF